MTETTHEDARAFLEHLSDQWRQLRADALPELFHEDGRLIHPAMTEFIPREEIPAYFRSRLAVVPDYSLTIDDWAFRGNTLLVEWTFTGTIGGHRPPNFHGVHRFTLRGQKAVEAVAYYDTAAMMTLIQEAIERGDIVPEDLERLTAGQEAARTT